MKEELQARIERFEARRTAKIERLKERAANIRAKHDGNDLSLYGEAKSGIPMGQPILVGHHSERRHWKHLERIERKVRAHYEANEYADKLESRAENTSDAIMSNDPQADCKIKAKIESLKQANEYSKKINKLLRPFHLVHIEQTIEHFAKLTDDDSKWIVQYLSNKTHWYACKDTRMFKLSTTNNGAEIRRLENRLVAQSRIETGFEPFNIGQISVELVDGQIQVEFPIKPSEESRSKLKSSPLALKWSNYSKKWVRKHTDTTSGRYFNQSLREILTTIAQAECLI